MKRFVDRSVIGVLVLFCATSFASCAGLFVPYSLRPAVPVSLKKFVVIGTGDIVMRKKGGYRAAAARVQSLLSAPVFFLDDSRHWQGRDRSADISAIVESGSEFVDYRDSGLKQTLSQLNPTTVFIATPDDQHIPNAIDALESTSSETRIILEKPLSRTLLAAQEFANYLRERGWTHRVFVVDHFRARFPKLDVQTVSQISAHLGGELMRARIIYTEDGPVPESRMRALSGGMILDLVPHALAVMEFLDPDFSGLTFRSMSAAKRSDLIDGVAFPKETFGQIEYRFRDKPLTIYLGKGVGGVRIAGNNYYGNAKLIFAQGMNPSAAVLVDMGSQVESTSNGIHLLQRNGAQWTIQSSIALQQMPYDELLQMEQADPVSNHGIVPFQTALRMQELIDEVLAARDEQYPGNNFRGYLGGTDEQPGAMLKEVIQSLGR